MMDVSIERDYHHEKGVEKIVQTKATTGNNWI